MCMPPNPTPKANKDAAASVLGKCCLENTNDGRVATKLCFADTNRTSLGSNMVLLLLLVVVVVVTLLLDTTIVLLRFFRKKLSRKMNSDLYRIDEAPTVQ